MREPARRVGLISEIDGELRLLKVRLPYPESDHVLTSQRSETPTTGSRGCALRLKKAAERRLQDRLLSTTHGPPDRAHPVNNRLLERETSIRYGVASSDVTAQREVLYPEAK